MNALAILIAEDASETIGPFTRAIDTLVRATPAYVQADGDGQVIHVASDNRIILSFLTDSVAAECATELAKLAKSYPHIELRMGLHRGAIHPADDGATDLATAHQAQIVADLGDAGHILLTHAIANPLRQNPMWETALHQVAETEVDDGSIRV